MIRINFKNSFKIEKMFLKIYNLKKILYYKLENS